MKKTGSLCVMGFLVLLTTFALFTSGCAGRRTTTTESTTEVRTEPVNTNTFDSEGRETVAVTKTEQVTQEPTHKGFFGIVGDIIALPFRAIGSVL